MFKTNSQHSTIFGAESPVKPIGTIPFERAASKAFKILGDLPGLKSR